jgi:AraC-like DNA-binding protein
MRLTQNHPAASMSAAHVRLFLRELRGRELDVGEALHVLSQSTPSGRDHESTASARLLAFLRICERVAGDENLGLRAGQRVLLDDLSLLGLLLRACSDGRAMVDVLQRYADSWSGSVELTAADTLRVYAPLLPAGEALPRVLAECALARALSVARMMLGAWVKPAQVELAFPRPLHTAPHEALFGCPLIFEAEHNALTFSSELLSARSPHRDPALRRVLERHLQKTARPTRAAVNDIVEQVREVVSAQLASGQVSLLQVATTLERSERTLRRQLRYAGTRYQELLDEQRRQIAVAHLREQPRRSAVRLSDALGFSNPAAFYRAFKRWTGARWSAYSGDDAAPSPSRPGEPGRSSAMPLSPSTGP